MPLLQQQADAQTVSAEADRLRALIEQKKLGLPGEEKRDTAENAFIQAMEAYRPKLTPGQKMQKLNAFRASGIGTILNDVLGGLPAEEVAGRKKKSAANQDMSDMPDPVANKGKIIEDTTSGVRYRSDGTKWVKQ